MFVLITYDVNITSAHGAKRLRNVARACLNYGKRVQNSVFECSLDAAQLVMLQSKLCDLIDKSKDSLRFYLIGNHYENKIQHYGVKAGYDPNDTLIV